MDVSRVGSFFGDVAPSAFDPVTTSWYSPTIADAFDVTLDYAFGGSVYRTLPTEYVRNNRKT